jgi:HD domain-containing protein
MRTIGASLQYALPHTRQIDDIFITAARSVVATHPLLGGHNANWERRNSRNVALAGDHAHRESDSWRDIATHVYLYALAAIGLALLVFFPPRFDPHPGTIISVALVAIFLVLMERPMQTAAVTTMAPLTAITAASAVVFGSWTIALAVVGWTAVRFRLGDGQEKWKYVFSVETLGQLGVAVITSYCVLLVWQGASHLIVLAPHYLASVVELVGIVFVGLSWQTINNLLAYPWYLIKGRPFGISQLLRTGVIASIYAYLLVATYKFGGLLATTVFYVVVAQIRVVQDVLGITAQLHKLEKAHDQARGLVRDLVHLTDAPNVEFSSEVQNIAQMMARRIGMSKKDIELLGLAAELHEIGKSRVPARVRSGLGLNSKELAVRKTYSRWGGLMVRAADALLPGQIADWIEFHGEHFDGSGYPRGLKGDDIPLASRIIAVAREYVCLLTGYDGAQMVEKEKALALLRESSGTLFDPRIVKLLDDIVS